MATAELHSRIEVVNGELSFTADDLAADLAMLEAHAKANPPAVAAASKQTMHYLERWTDRGDNITVTFAVAGNEVRIVRKLGWKVESRLTLPIAQARTMYANLVKQGFRPW